MNNLLELIKTVGGSNGGAFAITAGMLWFVFWAYGKFVKMTVKHEEFEKCCTELKDRVNSVETSVKKIEGEIQYVKSTLNTMVNMIQNSTQAVMQAHSPLALTEFGEQLAAGFGADAIVDRDFPTIRAKIDAEVTAKTPYDIQTYCLEKIPVFPEQFLDAEAMAVIKSYAFNNGKTLFELLKIVGIKARDAYFKATGIA